MPFKKIKEILSWAKFPIEILEDYEDEMEKLANARYTSSRETSWVFQLDREEDDKYLDELNKATFEHARTSDFEGILSGISKATDVIKTVIGLITNYYNYRSVTRADVAAYIKEFRASKDGSLRFAADCLEAMTMGDAELIAYLGLSWGANYLAKKVKSAVYSAIQKALPPAWKYTIMGVSMANDFIFNTTETTKVALDYSVVYETLGGYSDKLRSSLYLFKSDPLKYYEQFRSDFTAFMLALRLEFGYFQQLCEAVDDSLVQKFWILVDQKNKHTFDGEKTYNLVSNIMEDALAECYNISVGPYKK